MTTYNVSIPYIIQEACVSNTSEADLYCVGSNNNYSFPRVEKCSATLHISNSMDLETTMAYLDMIGVHKQVINTIMENKHMLSRNELTTILDTCFTDVQTRDTVVDTILNTILTEQTPVDRDVDRNVDRDVDLDYHVSNKPLSVFHKFTSVFTRCYNVV